MKKQDKAVLGLMLIIALVSIAAVTAIWNLYVWVPV